MLRAGLSKPALHRESDAESSFDGSGCLEAAREIEAFCVRVADDLQDARGAAPRHIGATFDQQSPKTSFPECRLDEQRIEFGIPVRSRKDRGEADNHAIALGHKDVASAM